MKSIHDETISICRNIILFYTPKLKYVVLYTMHRTNGRINIKHKSENISARKKYEVRPAIEQS